MQDKNVKRKLAAILSADVKGYSRLMREDELATIEMLNSCRGVITELVRQHHGRVVDMPGDNILAEFASVVEGVQAAVAIQKELKAKNSGLPKNRRMEFRIGINLGDIVADDDRIYGDGVNIAAMLETIADPGGICISRTAYDQIEDKLPLGYEYIGEKSVKVSSKPVHAYKVILAPQDIRHKFTKWKTDHLGKEKPVTDGKDDFFISKRSRLLAVILCLCFGIFGVHRFYAGKARSAKVMLFTIGGLGLWYVADIVLVLFGGLIDDEGKKIRRWV